ncbi:MAG: 3-hydroxyacyl-CoA dehydrogenase NAD-binding domain-containing protein [Terriglobia bacterium]
MSHHRRIERIAVIGAGVMGSQIAAHFVNAGFSVALYDVPAPGSDRALALSSAPSSPGLQGNELVRQGLQKARLQKPSAFFIPEWAEHVYLGNLRDDLEHLAEADWIIEAIPENLQLKQELLTHIATVRRPGSVISSNTSGISLHELANGRSEEFRRHWLGTHFFNPPRTMKLLELIPTEDTDPRVLDSVKHLAEKRLGKGIVIAKDTPGFVANRMGIFAVQHALKLALEEGFSIEETDLLTGPLVGRPKSATFRTIDLVGLDTYLHVARHLFQNLSQDEQRDVFTIPLCLTQMIERNWLGEKTGRGFYSRTGKDEIQSLDLVEMAYHPRARLDFPSLDPLRSMESPGERIKAILALQDRPGRFLWKTLSAVLLYAAHRVPEISDEILRIDQAMKWGFNWKLGPFETWDAIGVAEVVNRVQAEGLPIPPIVEAVLDSLEGTFYRRNNGKTSVFDLRSKSHHFIPDSARTLLLGRRKEEGAVLQRNASASLLDLGDGVACVEFHSKMNTIDNEALVMIEAGLALVEEDNYGLVIGNEGDHFSAGANLHLILQDAENEHWHGIDRMIKKFQEVNMAIKYAPNPVVAAPFGITLGGGCEICLHAGRLQAAAELSLGLVELGVGLIPAGGGTKEMLLRSQECLSVETIDPTARLQEAFDTISQAKVSTSAADAQRLGLLRTFDGISMNQDHLIYDAKQAVRYLMETGYKRPHVPQHIIAVGNRGLAPLKIALHQLRRGGFISEYDAALGVKLAYVLCGGDCNSVQQVSEQYLLDLEREIFLSLCGERKTRERIKYMLQKGKPLRN